MAACGYVQFTKGPEIVAQSREQCGFNNTMRTGHDLFHFGLMLQISQSGMFLQLTKNE